MIRPPWQAFTSPTSSRPSTTGGTKIHPALTVRWRLKLAPWLRSTHRWFFATNWKQTNFQCCARPCKPGWPGMTRHLTHPALRSVPPVRETRNAKAVDALLPRCSYGCKCGRLKNARSGGASRLKAGRGDLTNMPSGRPRALISSAVARCRR